MTLDEITADVKEKQIVTTTMGELRDATGSKRLGKHIRMGIENALHEAGINSFPPVLPASQNAIVRLYNESSDLGKIFMAISNPSEENDEILRDFLQKGSKKSRDN